MSGTHTLLPITSVIVCTRNRASVLRETLPHILDAIAPHASVFEVIVVDNGSTDETKAVIGTLAASASFVRYVLEPELGLNPARNAGFKAARGRYLWYLDDDALPSPSWAMGVQEAFSSGADMIAGRVLLRWPNGQPTWLPVELLGSYSALDLGEHNKEMEWPRIPFGVNMGIRKDVVAELGGFQRNLDRQGSNLLSNGDKEFAYRVYLAGRRVHYSPKALVHHLVSQERVSVRWLMRRAYWGGISDVAFARLKSDSSSTTRLRLGWYWLKRHSGATIGALARGRQGWVLAVVRSVYAYGAAWGARRLSA